MKYNDISPKLVFSIIPPGADIPKGNYRVKPDLAVRWFGSETGVISVSNEMFREFQEVRYNLPWKLELIGKDERSNYYRRVQEEKPVKYSRSRS